jgi:N-acetylneuraminic acid mutarotase
MKTQMKTQTSRNAGITLLGLALGLALGFGCIDVGSIPPPKVSQGGAGGGAMVGAGGAGAGAMVGAGGAGGAAMVGAGGAGGGAMVGAGGGGAGAMAGAGGASGAAGALPSLVWQEPAAVPIPTGRSGHAMATLGNKVIMFGGGAAGESNGLQSGDETWEWDGKLWTQLHPPVSPPARSSHAMATLGNKVIMFGGSGLDDTWAWDGNVWTELHPPVSPLGRSGHAMATLGNKIVLFGGEALSAVDQSPVDVLGDTWEWDGTSWKKVAPLARPPARTGHAMATLGNKIVLFGGDASTDLSMPLGDTWEWDGATWSHHPGSTSPPAGVGHAMATLGNKVILFGHYLFGQTLDDPTTWLWDGSNWTYACVQSDPSCPTPIYSFSTFLGEFPTQRSYPAMATLNGAIVLFGGDAVGAPCGSYDETWEWKGTRWFQRLSPPGNEIVSRPAPMASLGGKVVLFNHHGPGSTWEWDGTVWRQLTPSTSPPGSWAGKRVYGPMATLGDKVVLLDGSSPGSTGKTWEWDGTNWTQIIPTTLDSTLVSPPVWDGSAIATLGNKVILFDASGSTWQWDGKLWTQLHPPVSPSGRSGHAMATLGNKVVLFGGSEALPTGISSRTPSDDTWQWDGATWTRMASPTGPPARTGHAMTALGNIVVLFGGVGADADNPLLHDTWAWDGTRWTQLAPLTNPPARSGHAMATLGDKVVLFGGSSDGKRNTWLLGSPTH